MIFIILGILASLISFYLFYSKFVFLNSIDYKLKDARFKVRKNIQPDDRIVIAAIDSKSVNELGRWPWDRKIIAELITSLKEFYRVKTIAFDIIFSEKSNLKSDTQLALALKKANNCVLGYFFREEEEKENTGCLDILEEKSRIVNLIIGKNVKSIPIITMSYVELNILELSKAAKSFGFFNIFSDRDGLIRNATLIINYEGALYPSLPLEALRQFTENEIKIKIEDFGVDKIFIGNEKLPSDEFGRLALNFYGPQGIFKTYSIVDIINHKIPPEKLKGKLIFVGATEIGISDIRATPVDPVLPGVEIHATIASNFLQKNFLIKNAYTVAIDAFFILVFPLILMSIIAFARKTLIAFLIFICILSLYSFTNYYIFANYNYNLSVIYTFISILLSYFLSEAYRNLIEERQSRFLKKAFSSYVSDKLVSQIVENPDLLKLGGEKKIISILFSDIRGFTTLSEKTPPEKLVELLNLYFSPMTNIVLKNNGTLDKFIGDAIMALFNVPIEIENHPYYACKTAAEMIAELPTINNIFKNKNLPLIDIGIGINTGEAVVGNMGTDLRFDYTAIGDSVNLASRLEGTNKFFGTKIIVSEFTYEYVSDKFKFRMLDKIKVKGKEEGVTIYELNQNLENEVIEKFQQALGYYFERNFKKAIESFEYLIATYNDKASLTFLERCKYYLQNPPEESWDGVFVLTSK